MQPSDIIGYQYKADNYCPTCVLDMCREGEEYDPFESVETQLYRYASRLGIHRDDEATFDSDEFPKVLMASQDCGEHCGACQEPLVEHECPAECYSTIYQPS